MPDVGDTVLHFRLEEKLGRGGFATVYRARDLRLEREVAVKFLHPQFAGDEAFLARFSVEARTAASIRHPHLVTLYDIGTTENGLPFLVMELLKGETLRGILRRRGMLALSQVTDLLAQLASALDHLHARRVIHRDLKPENVIVDAEGRATLMDYGIARALDAASTTMEGHFVGTPPYMAPEQIIGRSLTAGVDLYALGVVCYELLSGRPPFEGEASAVMFAHANEAPPPIRSPGSEISPSAAAAIGRMLAKRPEERFPSATSFVEVLREAIDQVEGNATLPLPSRPAPYGAHPNNLPVQPTPLVGRQRELERLHSLLRSGEVRLLTLTGPGGTGKTRLSLQIAADLLGDFADGVFLVELAPISEPELVVATIMQVLGVGEVSGRWPLECLKDELRPRQLLLVLDNFEQVLAAAPVVADLLASCPRVKVLASSRAALRLRGEQEFPVPPLDLPDPAAPQTAEILSQSSAVALFVQRATAAKPDLVMTDSAAEAMGEICRRLDGLPLAIELAAARIKLLAPEAMMSRLQQRLKLLTGGARDLPARQQTLRSTISWSYDLLEPREQRVFRWLSVFVGGCTLEATISVCDVRGESDLDVLDGIGSLVEKNLVRVVGEQRFGMLETIREYALDQMESAGEAEGARRRHAQYFLELAEQAGREVEGPDQAMWMERLEIEHDNLRAAIEWSLTGAGDAESGLRIAAGLWKFWQVHGHVSEGRQAMERTLAHAPNAPMSLIAGVLSHAGVLARVEGESRRSIELGNEGLALYRELGDRRGISMALTNLGAAERDQGNQERAAELHSESLELLRGLGEKRALAIALGNVGLAARDRGDYERAVNLYGEALDLVRGLGDSDRVAWLLLNLAGVMVELQDYDHAAALCDEAFPIAEGMQHKFRLAWLRRIQGMIARGRGDCRQAWQRLCEALDRFQELNDRQGIAYCLRELAATATTDGRPVDAAQLLGCESALRESAGFRLTADVAAHCDQYVTEVHSALGDAAFAAAWAEGRTRPHRDVVVRV